MYYVYILQSQLDKLLYVGQTQDLIYRLKRHNNGEVTSTKNRIPLKLLCYEAYLTRAEAMSREKYLKSSDGKKELYIRLKKSL